MKKLIFTILILASNLSFGFGYGSSLPVVLSQKISSNDGSSKVSLDVHTPNLCPQHYPLGSPVYIGKESERVNRRTFFLCHSNYAVGFDPATKTPLWVSEKLIGEQQKNSYVERVDAFAQNPFVPKSAQATLADYVGTKFDRGHNAPAADMLDDHAMLESFYLTNMFPQVGPNMNRGIWADLEGLIRKWSVTQGEVLVITGPIYESTYSTIGKSGVAVPTYLYKIVLNSKTLENVSFIMPNNQIITRKVKKLDEGNPQYPQTLPTNSVNCGRVCTIDDFIVPISVVELKTGLQFFSKKSVDKNVKGRMWPANY